MPGTSLGTAYVQIVPSAQGISGSITQALGGEAEQAGIATGSKIGAFAKKALGKVAIGAAIVTSLKSALSEGAALQQSYMGGVDTLYGEAADGVRKYAREAAAAGISMNEYSEQAVSFGAALKQAYGGDAAKAMEAANTAILDMTDNAAKMGTPLESIQNAYQGFAKQNYTMLDNLKLGYGGTKTEMERLLKDAQKISGVEYNIDNLGDVYEAIHVIQGELGLTGVAAEEASQTFSGSFNAMKASLRNFFGTLALGEDIKPALHGLLTSVDTFVFNNLIPMIGTIIKGLPDVIWAFISEGIPMLVGRASSFLQTAAETLKGLASNLSAEKIKTWALENVPRILAAAADLIKNFASGLINNLPQILASLRDIGLAVVTGLGSALFEKVTAGATGIKDRFLTVLHGLWQGVVETATNIRDGFMSKIHSIRDSIAGVVTIIKDRFLAPIYVLRDSVSNAIQALKDGFMSRINSVRDSVGSVASAIKDKFLSPIETLKNKIKGIVDAIKGFFNFSVSAPHIPLPHFYISPSGWKLGDLLKGSIPSLGINWYAKGGIATSPVVAGIGEGKSDEAILPLDPFWKRMDRIANTLEKNRAGGDVTVNVYATPGMDVNELAETVQRKIIQTQKRRTAAWSRV